MKNKTKNVKNIENSAKSLIKKIKSDSKVGKYGLKNNSGLGIGGFFHVSMPYDAGKGVFVEKMDKEWGLTWERMSLSKAKRLKKTIITCVMCNKPAISLSHCWPYIQDFDRCKKHYNSEYKGEND